MLRLTKHQKSPVSDRLAIFAALVLTITSLAGIGNSVISAGEGNAALSSLTTADNASTALHSNSAATIKKNRNFKVSLFLFRSH